MLEMRNLMWNSYIYTEQGAISKDFAWPSPASKAHLNATCNNTYGPFRLEAAKRNQLKFCKAQLCGVCTGGKTLEVKLPLSFFRLFDFWFKENEGGGEEYDERMAF